MRWITRYEVSGSQGDPYTVSISEIGSWGCSCKAWIFTRKDHQGQKADCKHILATRDGLSLELAKLRAAAVRGGATPVVAVPVSRRSSERERLAAELTADLAAARKPLAPAASRFAGLDYTEAEVRSLAAAGARFQHLEFDIASKAAA